MCGGGGGESDKCWTAIGYMSIPPVLHSILMSGIDYSQDAIVMCGRLKMAHSVTEGWSHDKGRGERRVTGVQWGHEESVTGRIER